MKKMLLFLLAVGMILSGAISAYAENGKVTYSGNAGAFVFAPGSAYSLTDLFPNFKGVMPGDTLVQRITVRNNADDKVKVKIYIRSLGAQEDSVEFLSRLGLTVEVSEENEMGYMFNATAEQSAQLTDWVCLGMLYSGGEVNLDVKLHVPVELDNEFQDRVGYLDWEFMVEEFAAEPIDPKPPQTGDTVQLGPVVILMVCSGTAIALLLILIRRGKQKDEDKTK